MLLPLPSSNISLAMYLFIVTYQRYQHIWPQGRMCKRQCKDATKAWEKSGKPKYSYSYVQSTPTRTSSKGDTEKRKRWRWQMIRDSRGRNGGDQSRKRFEIENQPIIAAAVCARSLFRRSRNSIRRTVRRRRIGQTASARMKTIWVGARG